jgi:uncharacterized protein YbjT (DUF2867 family)
VKELPIGAVRVLGRHVVRAFRSRGHSVRALVRPAVETSQLVAGILATDAEKSADEISAEVRR